MAIAITQNTQGIIIGLDAPLEYLLPPFFLHLRRYSSLPVTIFDFGMSSIGLCFCKKRGRVISITQSLYPAEDESQKEQIKSMWFKKPLACKNTPFDLTLWLDLDCKIQGPLEPLFELLKPGSPLALRKEKEEGKSLKGLREIFPNIDMYNSGVMLFNKGSPLISLWVDQGYRYGHSFRGDQELLSYLIMKEKLCPTLIPKMFNHILPQEGFEDHHLSTIVHYTGGMKECLKQEYLTLEQVRTL